MSMIADVPGVALMVEGLSSLGLSGPVSQLAASGSSGSWLPEAGSAAALQLTSGLSAKQTHSPVFTLSFSQNLGGGRWVFPPFVLSVLDVVPESTEPVPESADSCMWEIILS